MISIFNGRKRTLGKSEEKDIYITMSVDFRQHLHTLKGAKLSVFMCIALHADEHGWSFPGISKIVEETGYSRDTIFDALNELEQVKIEGHHILLRHNVRKNGSFSNNYYLIFPTKEEIEYYKTNIGISPCRGFIDTPFSRHDKTTTLSTTSRNKGEPFF